MFHAPFRDDHLLTDVACYETIAVDFPCNSLFLLLVQGCRIRRAGGLSTVGVANVAHIGLYFLYFSLLAGSRGWSLSPNDTRANAV